MLGGAALWGSGCALAWGLSDFVARFAGRSVGAMAATFAMMTIGAALVAIGMAASGQPFDWHLGDFHWLIGISAGVAIGSILFFHAITHGPVSLASPLVASYPAIAVPITVALGARPDPIHWVAMAATMAGVWLVARAVSAKEGGDGAPEYSRAVIRRSIAFSLGAAAIWAAALIAGDRAVEAYGPWQTTLVVRLIGSAVLFLVVLVGRQPLRFPRRSWPFLLGFGVLDTAGHVLLYVGLTRENSEYAMIASSAYTVVTVMLARAVLREPVSAIQWGGVALVVSGIGVLAAFG